MMEFYKDSDNVVKRLSNCNGNWMNNLAKYYLDNIVAANSFNKLSKLNIYNPAFISLTNTETTLRRHERLI